MRLKTIWTLRGLPLKERLYETRKSLYITLAYRLPKRLRYWVLITTTMDPDWIIPEVTFMEVVEKAGKDLDKV